MSDFTPPNDKDSSSNIRPRQVISPPNLSQGSFTSRYNKPEADQSIPSPDSTQSRPSKPEFAVGLPPRVEAHTARTTRPNISPATNPRPVVDKIGEDLKKHLSTLSKLTANSENGLAFMPLTATLEDIQQQKSANALSISVLALGSDILASLTDFFSMSKDTGQPPIGAVIWECSEIDPLAINDTKPLWLRPNGVLVCTPVTESLAGHRLLIIPRQIELNCVMLGYIEHFSDVLVVLGNEQDYFALRDATPPALIALKPMATLICPFLLTEPNATIPQARLIELHRYLSAALRYESPSVDRQKAIALNALQTVSNSEIGNRLFRLAGLPEAESQPQLQAMVANRGYARRAGIIAGMVQNAVQNRLIKLDRQLAQSQTRQELFSQSILISGQKPVLQRIQSELFAELDSIKDELDNQGRNEFANKKSLVIQLRTALEAINKPESFVGEIKPNFLSSIGLGALARIFGSSSVLLSLSNLASEELRKSVRPLLLKHLKDMGHQFDHELKHLTLHYQERLQRETGLNESFDMNIQLPDEVLESLLNDHIAAQLDTTTASYQVKFERKGLFAHLSKARMAVSSVIMVGALIASSGGFQRNMKQTAVVTAIGIAVVLLINLLFWPSQERHTKQQHLNDLHEKLLKLLNDMVHKLIGQYCGLYKQRLDQQQKLVKQQFDQWLRREDELKTSRQAELEQLNKEKKELEAQRRVVLETLQSSLSKPGISGLSQDLQAMSDQLSAEIANLISASYSLQ